MKKSKRTLTPKLRFPDFRNEPEWKEVPLEQIAERTTTKNLDRSITRVLTNSAEHGVVDQRDYFDKDIANNGNIDRYYIVDLGDYVYNPRISTLAPVGPISRNNIGKGVMSPLYTVFRFTDENTDFYQHYFKAVSWHLYLRRASSMGARHDRMSITTRDFMAMPVPTPLPQEQQKIAECLSSLDGLIAGEGRKLTALREHKKALMQQLFPRPGKTQPRLRFPAFREKGEWEEKAISGLGEVITGSTPSTTRSEYYGGDRQFVSPADISQLRFIRETKTTLTELGFQQTRLIKAKSVLFVCIGSTIGKVAQNLKECATNQQINSVTAGTGTSSDFLYYLLSECSERIAEIAGNQAVPIINKSLFSGFKVLCPKEDEQQRIADCLTSIDTQIAAQTAKIEALKQHKRGLMQQLFPAPEVRK